MPSLSAYKEYANINGGTTIADRLRSHSNFAMEETWDHNIQSHPCYIYDYFHDDQPDLKSGMTYENTTKTKIDAKLIITEYGSLSKDQPSAHILLRPSQPVQFKPNDELYYYEEYVKKYYAEFPVGLYIDIPDEKGVYHKWLICLKDIVGNQFQKYFVLPVTYQLKWVEHDHGKRIKRKMWSVLRSQSSYNSGLWIDTRIYTRENQDKIWLPLNSISEKIWYLSEDDKENQRLIVDVPCANPNVWQVSKVEHTHPFGLHKLTIYQTEFNPHKDYVNLDTGEMYADYYLPSDIEPENVTIVNNKCRLSSSTPLLKVGGSYKTITCQLMDDNDTDITSEYNGSFNWSFLIGKDDITNTDIITVKQSEKNKIKIKFSNDTSYLSKILTIRCSLENNISGELQLSLVTL